MMHEQGNDNNVINVTSIAFVSPTESPIGDVMANLDTVTLMQLQGYAHRYSLIENPILVVRKESSLVQLLSGHDESLRRFFLSPYFDKTIIIHSSKTIAELGDAVCQGFLDEEPPNDDLAEYDV